MEVISENMEVGLGGGWRGQTSCNAFKISATVGEMNRDTRDRRDDSSCADWTSSRTEPSSYEQTLTPASLPRPSLASSLPRCSNNSEQTSLNGRERSVNPLEAVSKRPLLAVGPTFNRHNSLTLTTANLGHPLARLRTKGISTGSH